MGSPSRTRLQSCRSFSCWGPSLPWLLQPQRLSLQLLLIPTMAMDTVATDTVDTTGLMATMAYMERGLLRLSQRPLPTLPLWLTPLLMLMPGTATTATDTVAMDTVDTTGLMATMAIMERGLLRQSQSPPLLPTLTLLLSLVWLWIPWLRIRWILQASWLLWLRPLRLRTQIRLLPSIRIRLLWLRKEVRRGRGRAHRCCRPYRCG